METISRSIMNMADETKDKRNVDLEKQVERLEKENKRLLEENKELEQKVIEVLKDAIAGAEADFRYEQTKQYKTPQKQQNSPTMQNSELLKLQS